MKNKRGFTLLEMLMALFIFTILSFMLVLALRTVIHSQSRTELKAERLHHLQMALLVLSREIEQAMNRPIVNAAGKEEAAFMGKPQECRFTHAGLANSAAASVQGGLQRTGYGMKDNILFRISWPVLDQTQETKSQQKNLLMDVTEIRFQYLDHQGRFHDDWPLDAESHQPLPRGVRIYLNLAHWGKITQLYLVPAYK